MQTDPEKPASGNRGSANKDEMDKEDPTQSIPDWLQPFTDNQEDLETHMSANSSERENSDSEGAAKVVTHKNGSTIFILTSPKIEIADVCLRTKITRVPCRRRSEGSIPCAVEFGDLITADLCGARIRQLSPSPCWRSTQCYYCPQGCGRSKRRKCRRLKENEKKRKLDGMESSKSKSNAHFMHG